MTWGKKVPIQWADYPLELCKGWTEIWEFGQFLGMFDCLGSLEAYVQARPKQAVRRPVHPAADRQPGRVPAADGGFLHSGRGADPDLHMSREWGGGLNVGRA